MKPQVVELYRPFRSFQLLYILCSTKMNPPAAHEDVMLP